jgi:hypothetical protein
MGMKLKTCLASMAMLVATAAHAKGAASSSPSAEGDTTYRSTEASAGPGGGSGELKVDRAATSPTEKKVEGNWNRQEFLRNTDEARAVPGRAASGNWNRQEFLRNTWSTP